MSLKTPGLRVEIAMSNMNLYPLDLPGQPSWMSRLEAYLPYLEKTGYSSIEVHPTRAILKEMKEGSALAQIVVGSLHQTFNTGRGRDRICDVAGVLRTAESVGAMAVMQACLDRRVPAVYYPGHGDESDSYSTIQPCAEVYDKLAVRSNEELLRTLGKKGLCPDVVHARCKDKRYDGENVLPPIDEVWADQFASGRVFEMHVGADRSDMAGRDPDIAATSSDEFRAFLAGEKAARETQLADMIEVAIENWAPPEELCRSLGEPVLRMVVEIPPALHPWDFLRRTAQHARFVESLAGVVSDSGATPLLWGAR